jgi:hypothetical protein
LANRYDFKPYLKSEVKWMRRFIKADYGARHCQYQSCVGNHSIMWALCSPEKPGRSEPTEPEFDCTDSFTKVPEGTQHCAQCDRIPQFFATLNHLLDIAEGNKDALCAHDNKRARDLHRVVSNANRDTREFMGHSLRKVQSRVVSLLRQSPECMPVGTGDHIHDYISKIEEMFHTESQALRFGKRGKSCFGHSFLTRAPEDFNLEECCGNGSLVNVCVRLFCNDSHQDTEMAMLSLPVAIELFKGVVPFVTRLNASKDGASNFGDAYQLAYPRILEKLGLEAATMDTPETGAGKDRCDQDFNGVSGSIRRAVNAGADAISAKTMCEAADRGQGADKGKINREIILHRGTLGKFQPPGKFFPGRCYQLMHSHKAGKYDGTRMHRYGGLKTQGRFFSRSEINAVWPNLDELVKGMKCDVKRHGPGADKEFTAHKMRTGEERDASNTQLSKKQTRCAQKKGDQEMAAFRLERNRRSIKEELKQAFYCPNLGCNKFWLKETGRRRHMPDCTVKLTKQERGYVAVENVSAEAFHKMLQLGAPASVAKSEAEHCATKAECSRPSCANFNAKCSNPMFDDWCACDVHFELEKGWATHASNPVRSAPHSADSKAFMLMLFDASCHNEASDSYHMMNAHFVGGLGKVSNRSNHSFPQRLITGRKNH